MAPVSICQPAGYKRASNWCVCVTLDSVLIPKREVGKVEFPSFPLSPSSRPSLPNPEIIAHHRELTEKKYVHDYVMGFGPVSQPLKFRVFFFSV